MKKDDHTIIYSKEAWKEIAVSASNNIYDLCTHIHGEGYYNLGTDPYNCNRIACDDIKYSYDDMKRLKRTYQILFYIVAIVAIIGFIF